MLNEDLLLSAKMLNIQNMLNVLGRIRRQCGLSLNLPKTQHIQHVSRKKHTLIQHGAPEFNIFNISPERMRFFEKSRSFC